MRRLILAVVTGLVLLLTSGLSAQAEDGFRFWGFYSWDGQAWVFASSGADEHIPSDGDVDGWRHAVSGNTPRYPRFIGDFDVICAGVPGETNRKQVAVIIDYGTDEDASDGAAPDATGTCVVAPPDATSLELLHAVAELRISGARVCGVNSFPSEGCGGPVADIDVPTGEELVELTITEPVGSNRWDPSTAPVEERATATPEPQPMDEPGNWQDVVIGAGILVIIIGTGFVLTRRRQRI